MKHIRKVFSSNNVINSDSVDRVIIAENYYENKNVVTSYTTAKISRKNFKKYLKPFKLWLKQEAKKCCNFDSVSGIKKFVGIAPLQFTTKKQHRKLDLDDNTKKQNLFWKLQHAEEMCKPPVGDLLFENFFKEAMIFAIKSADQRTFAFFEAKKHYINQVGNIVGILGGAGMGKTTLMKQLLQQTLDENKRLYDAEYVFYLQLRNLNYKIKTSFLHFLLPGSIPTRFVENKTLMNMLLDELNENDNVCLIMDGFDEADLSSDFARSIKTDIHDIAYAENFIQNLLQGNILPKAKKLLSSRPGQLFEIHEDSRPKFLVNILGLDKNAQEQICEEICGGNAKQVFSVIQENPNLSNICCAPFHCIIAYHCIKKILERSENEELSNQINLNYFCFTTVLAIMNCRFMKSSHIREKFETSKLATLAWKGLQQNKLRFDENDLGDVGLENVNINAYLDTISQIEELPLLEGLEKKYTYFSHKILQEFYAALKILLFMSVDDFFQIFCADIDKPSFDIFSSKYENVMKFLCGLCNDRTFGFLKKSVSSCTYPVEQQKILQKVLLRETVSFLCPDLLKVFHFVHEMRDDDFSKKVAEKLSNHVRISDRLSRRDVIALCYVLHFRTSLLLISFEIDSFSSNWMEFLFEKMSFVFIDTAAIVITDLSFKNSPFFEFSETLHAAIQKLVRIQNKPLRSLQFEWSNSVLCICEPKIIDCKIISQSICNIDELHLKNFQNEVINFKLLCKAVRFLSKPLRKLYLSDSLMRDEEVLALSSCLYNIKELILSGCFISNLGIEALAKSIACLRLPMKKLDISYNKIDDFVLSLLTTKCLEKVENLSVKCRTPDYWNSHSIESRCLTIPSSDGLKHLLGEIKKLPKPLKEWQVRIKVNVGNLFSVHNISSIRNLYLSRYIFNEEAERGITNIIKNLAQPLDCLVLQEIARKKFQENNDKNEFSKKTHILLRDCFHNIKELLLINYKSTPRAINNMAIEIKKKVLLLNVSGSFTALILC